MHLKRFIALIAVAAPSVAFAGTPLTADSMFLYGGARYEISVDREANILSVVNVKIAAGRIQTAGEIRSVTEAFLEPTGCGVPQVKLNETAFIKVKIKIWEAEFICPSGTDLRALIISQRTDLKKGATLHK